MWRPSILDKPGAVPTLFGYFLGWGLGGLTVAWFEKKYLEAKYEVALRKEIEATKEFYRVLHKKDISPNDLIDDIPESESDDEAEADYEETYDKDTEEAIEVIKEYFPEAEVIEVVTHENEPVPASQEEISAADLSEIHVFTFYREDATLVSEEGLPVYHPEDQIGLNNFRGLDDTPEDQFQVCFLDEEKAVGYMIDLVDGSYEGRALKHQRERHRGGASVRKFRQNDDRDA